MRSTRLHLPLRLLGTLTLALTLTGAAFTHPPAPAAQAQPAPVLHTGVQTEAIIAAQASSTGSTSYKFLYTDGQGRAARWNGCKPIAWAYNPARQRAYGLADAKAAIAKMEAATGMDFVYKGKTASAPGSSTFPKGVHLRIGWAPTSNPAFASSRASLKAGYTLEGVGLAWYKWYTLPDGSRTTPEIVRGEIVLNSKGNKTRRGRKLSFMHELGHTTGLGHVHDARELMYPYIQTKDRPAYGAGDRAGLHKVGRNAGCFLLPIR